MRAWNVVGKYPIYDNDNSISYTEIVIASTTNGYATFTERVAGDHTNDSESDLVKLALDSLFKSEFSDRAMSESVQKIAELESITRAAKKFMKETEEKFSILESRWTDSEANRNNRFKAIEDKFRILNGSVMEVITALYADDEEVEDDDNSEKTINDNDVDGSDDSTDNENTETE